ncbi:MAG: hypothetical protein LUG85_01960 [Clostridiales bacterium]|nr:hypothetical protein [Clostridiales bacterium]
MTVKELCEKCNFTAITLPDGGREINGCYIGDLLSWVMGRAEEGNAWITIMSNINIAAVASLADVSCVILAEGVELEDSVKTTAAEKDINILSSPLPAYETAVKLYESI